MTAVVGTERLLQTSVASAQSCTRAVLSRWCMVLGGVGVGVRWDWVDVR